MRGRHLISENSVYNTMKKKSRGTLRSRKNLYRIKFAFATVSLFLGIKHLTRIKKSNVIPDLALEDPSSKLAYSGSAVFTPYHLTPGGGERVILNFVKKFQHLTGETVDLLVTRENICHRTSCLKKLAANLDVKGIDWNRVAIKRGVKQSAKERYNIWFSMGNELLPAERNRGRIGIYHCQFPFDGSFPGRMSSGLRRLSTYHVVYLNSLFTETWFDYFVSRVRMSVFPHSTGKQIHLPRVVHFSPPFTTLPKSSGSPVGPLVDDGFEMRRTGNIILLGRFFEGIQCKRQFEAIKAFRQLKMRMPFHKLNLFLVGHVVTGQQRYYEKLRKLAREVKNVELIANADPQTVEDTIRRADVVWSLTGLGGGDELQNPADAEHFGLALLECMSAGIVPVVTNRGGPREILNGFPEYLMIDSITELRDSTERVLRSPPDQYMSMQEMAIKRAIAYSHEFDDGVDSLFTIFGKRVTEENHEWWFCIRHSLKTLELPVGSLPSADTETCGSVNDDEQAVLYFDERNDYALRATMSQLQARLPGQWRMHIWHTQQNKHFVQKALEGLNCVVFHSIETLLDGHLGFDPRQESQYNQIFKNGHFLTTLGSSVRHVLTVQADSWFPPKSIFNNSWLRMDYIGAPWCHQGNWGYLEPSERPPEAYEMLHSSRKIPEGMRVGNGGVSLRNVPAMLTTIQKFRHESPDQENEDIFYVYFFHKDNRRIADQDEASEFGVEVFCSDIETHTRMVQYLRRAKRFRQEDHLVSFAVHKPFEVLNQLYRRRPSSKQVALFLGDFFLQ